MREKVKRFFSLIDAVTEKIGRGISLLILVMMLVTAVEVIARYVFNNPTVWVWPINRQLFGVYILFGGIYTLLHGGHIRVEVFYNRFSAKMKSVAGVIALICFLSFLGVLFWQGTWMAGNSLMCGERASGAFRIPLYPFKTLVPIAALLFLLQGIVNFFRKGVK